MTESKATVGKAAGRGGVLVGLALGMLGLAAFNLGYLDLYQAFLPLLCAGLLLRVEVGRDWFLSVLLFAVSSSLLYTVGLFSLPLLIVSIILTIPLMYLFARLGMVLVPKTIAEDRHRARRISELCAMVQIALFARYLVFRSSGGEIPIQIGEFEELARFMLSEVCGWAVFALAYGVQHRHRYGRRYTPGLDFAGSFSTLMVTGLLFCTPYVAIMTLGVNTFGIGGLYLSAIPAAAAHLLVHTLTVRKKEIERQNDQLQTMNKDVARSERMAAIGQMSSTISHQILQKMGLLGLQCDLLRDSLEDRSTMTWDSVAETRGRVENLDASITDLNTTLSDLLVFSRDLAVHLEPGSLDELLDDVCLEAQTVATSRGIEVRYRSAEVDKLSPSGDNLEVLVVSLDRVKLKQAVLNVLSNAVEASKEGDHVVLGKNKVDAFAQVTVKDFGPGISDAVERQLFVPFVSTKKTGSGLGLAFTQKIVELHGGTVWGRNNPDRGATFTIKLPLHGMT